MISNVNAFGHKIPALAECAHSETLRGLLLRQLAGILQGHSDDARSLAERLLKAIAVKADDKAVACTTQELLEVAGSLQRLRRGLPERSARIVSQVQPYLTGKSVLDYGCGDGEVGRRISELGHTVSLCDIMDYRTEGARKLPWQLLSDGVGCIPFDGALDTLLLLTVLHHSEDPQSTLHRVVSYHPRRIVIIESVYGLARHEVQASHSLTCENVDALEWLSLPFEEQFRYACFWDWFYNKVINSGVLVTYNFSSPDVWRDRFRGVGYREAERGYLGIDQPLVPEFHVLQVFDAIPQEFGLAGRRSV